MRRALRQAQGKYLRIKKSQRVYEYKMVHDALGLFNNLLNSLKSRFAIFMAGVFRQTYKSQNIILFRISVN